MTPCEELGYKVGDKFIVTKGGTFSVGSVVMLYRDDNSYTPLFKLIKGSCKYNVCDGEAGAYLHLGKVKPIEESRLDTQIQDTIWLQLASLEKFARSFDYTYSQGGFHYFGDESFRYEECRVSLATMQFLHNACSACPSIVESTYLQWNKKTKKLTATKHLVKLVK